KFVYDDSSTATVEFAAISAHAPHPAAVRLFMEWATSDEGLTSMANLSTGTPGREGIPDNRLASKESWYKEPTELDETWSTDATETAAKKDFLAQWAKVFNYNA